MSATYRALLGEGDRYLAEAQGFLDGPTKVPVRAAAHAALAQAFYARAALEKPDMSAAILAAAAAAKASRDAAETQVSGTQDDPVVTSMNRHPAGKKRAPAKAAPRNAIPRSVN